MLNLRRYIFQARAKFIYSCVLIPQRLRAEVIDRERIIAELRAQIGAQRVSTWHVVMGLFVLSSHRVQVFGGCELVFGFILQKLIK